VWHLHTKCNFHTQRVISTRIVWFWHVISTRSVMLNRKNVMTTLTTVISTRTRCTRRVLFWHVCVWLRHARVWFTHIRVEFQLDTCYFKMNQLKLTKDYQKNPHWILTSCFTTSTSVNFTSYVWFWHPACNLNTHACDFDTLSVKILYYNMYINQRLQAHACKMQNGGQNQNQNGINFP
jgi:hypothetical protein